MASKKHSGYHRLSISLPVYLWSTSGLVVPQTATDHHRMVLNLNASMLLYIYRLKCSKAKSGCIDEMVGWD